MESNTKILFDNGTHKCIMFSFDDETYENSFLSVNQYLIVQNGTGILIDPGSESIFDELYDAVSKYVEINKIKFIFFSHQDPDVSGSIGQWAIATNAQLIMSSLWVRFMSHYGLMDMSKIVALPDHGAKLTFGENSLQFIPAHFLHSPGNFSLYDSYSKIVFSGDIGAAILPSIDGEKAVTNFEEHVKALEGFHQRYMGSNKLCKLWVKKIKEHEINMIAPQHGFVFKNENVIKFLDWLDELKCGSDLMNK